MQARNLLLSFGLLFCLFSLAASTSSHSGNGGHAPPSARRCKATPSDPSWPPPSAWDALNRTVQGQLIQTNPVAASCYPSSPFHSSTSCETATSQWNSTDFHSDLPESIDYPFFANHSCTPPTVPGGLQSYGECKLGAYPTYILNATGIADISVAVKFAAKHDVRLVIKNTGHDFCGRSAGAFSLSIWTHNIVDFELLEAFVPKGCSENKLQPEKAVKFGSGWKSYDLLTTLAPYGKTVVTGSDPEVGMAGLCGGGGHGPLTSTKGLVSDQILEAEIVTADGVVKVVNECQHQDLFFAAKGGGAGNWGVFTSYTVKSYPSPMLAVSTIIAMPIGNTSASIEAAYDAIADNLAAVPDVNDAGVSGSFFVFDKAAGMGLFGRKGAVQNGPEAVATFLRTDGDIDKLRAQIQPLADRWNHGPGNLTRATLGAVTQIPFLQYPSFLAPLLSNAHALLSSRLLPRESVEDPKKSKKYLREVMPVSANASDGGFLLAFFQSGRGVRDVAPNRQGAVNPAWRDSYFLAISGGNVPTELPVPAAVAQAADFLNAHAESAWRAWAPGAGGYGNEGNPFVPTFKDDFFGRNYDALLKVKRRYDPEGVFYARAGVASDEWREFGDGRLCRR